MSRVPPPNTGSGLAVGMRRPLRRIAVLVEAEIEHLGAAAPRTAATRSRAG